MRVLITGIFGQDATILARKCLNLGYEVWGTSRNLIKESTFNTIPTELLEESNSAREILDKILPNRIFHMAAQHSSSNTVDEATNEVRNAMYLCHVQITRNILAWQIDHPNSRSLIALSSQMYTPDSIDSVVNERTKFLPSTYYGLTKLEALKSLRLFRNEFKVHSKGAILFNHTSVLNKPEFLFPTIARQMVDILKGDASQIQLANPNAKVDISHAEEVCDGLFSFMENQFNSDLVFSSGKLVDVSEIISETFDFFNCRNSFEIVPIKTTNSKEHFLRGDSSLAQKEIGWKSSLPPSRILLEQVLHRLSRSA